METEGIATHTLRRWNGDSSDHGMQVDDLAHLQRGTEESLAKYRCLVQETPTLMKVFRSRLVRKATEQPVKNACLRETVTCQSASLATSEHNDETPLKLG